jgi:hypothetical protein
LLAENKRKYNEITATSQRHLHNVTANSQGRYNEDNVSVWVRQFPDKGEEGTDPNTYPTTNPNKEKCNAWQ